MVNIIILILGILLYILSIVNFIIGKYYSYNDYISKKAVYDIMEQEVGFVGTEGSWLNLERAYEKIYKLPSIPPRRRKKGEWVKSTKGVLPECNNCGYKYGNYSMNYCPNCGIKMENGDE